MNAREVTRIIFCFAVGFMLFWIFFGQPVVHYFSFIFFQLFVSLYFTSGIAMIVFCVMVFVRWNEEPEVPGIFFLTALVLFLLSMIGATLTLDSIYENIDISANSIGFWEDAWHVISSPFYNFEKPVAIENVVCLESSV